MKKAAHRGPPLGIHGKYAQARLDRRWRSHAKAATASTATTATRPVEASISGTLEVVPLVVVEPEPDDEEEQLHQDHQEQLEYVCASNSDAERLRADAASVRRVRTGFMAKLHLRLLKQKQKSSRTTRSFQMKAAFSPSFLMQRTRNTINHRAFAKLFTDWTLCILRCGIRRAR